MAIGRLCRPSWRCAKLRGAALFVAGLIALWSHGASAQSFTLTLQPNTLPVATQNTPYSQVITAVGGTAPYGFAVTSGALPVGMTLGPISGTLSGTATIPGTYNFTVTATDFNSNTGFRAYSFIIGTAGLLTINPGSLPNGSVGIVYSQTVTASGGVGGYVYSLSAGSLPPGLSLNAGSGAITGTPTTAGPYSFTVFARDSNGNTGSQAYSVAIGGTTLTVNPATLSNGTQGVAYSQTVSATGGTAPYTFSVIAGVLPTGISLNGSTGDITGTPSASGTFNFTIRAIDAGSNTGTRAYAVQVGTNSLTVNPASLPGGTQGSPYSQTVIASGGTAPYTFAVTAGALPTGLSLNAGSGVISGTPSATGTFNFTIGATDPGFNTGNRPYTVVVVPAPLVVNPASLPPATQGAAYSQTIVASGGTAPYSYVVLSGALPAGLTLNSSSGLISGTPTVNGTFNFTIQATDATPNTGTRAYTLVVGGSTLTISPASLPAGTQGLAYSQTVSASGGTGPYTLSLISGAVPPGLTFNAGSGLISGTPTTGGSYNFTIQAIDTLGAIGSRPYTVSIGTGSLTVNPSSLPAGSQGVAYSQTVSATGGTAPYTFTLLSGALPAGLSLNAGSGLISGTPSGSGSSSFTIRATDSLGNIGSTAYTVSIGTSSLTVNPATLPAGTQGVAYSQTVSATGGTGPYSFTLAAGALPAGLSLNAGSGAISGTPSASGSASFTVRATDTVGNIGSRAYTVSIGGSTLTVNPASLPSGSQGVAYSQTVSATGGTAPYTFTLASGALPAGLSLNAGSGVISGTPSASGSSSFSVQATDSLGNIGTHAYTVNIGTGSLTVNPSSLPPGTVGTGYSQTVSASGGTGPYTYAVVSGALPAGLSLASGSGAISGTPTSGGSASFSVRATDTLGNIGTVAYTVNIGTGSLVVNPASMPPGTVGAAYSQTVSASGGTGPYSFTLISGMLPAGLSFNAATGVVSGAPTATGSSSFSIRANDSAGNTGTAAYTINVGTASLAITPSSLPAGTSGAAYNQTLSATGGTGPYTFALTSGALPTGLSLNTATGVISGTPTAGGSSAFSLRVTDSLGNVGNGAYSIAIGTASLTVNPSSLPPGTAGTAYSQTVSASGGTGPYTFALSSGALPAGLSFNAGSGLIGGTPSAGGTFNFAIQATDNQGNVGSRAFVFNIGTASLSVNPASLPPGSTGVAYSQTVNAAGGTGPYTFALLSGALPTGLSLNAGSGLISGTPTSGGTFAFRIGATDAMGNTGNRAFSINIGGASLTIAPATLPPAVTSRAYRQTLSATGGTAPYSFSVSAGALPAGLSLNASTGVISGVSSALGAASFTIQVVDAAGNTGARSYSMVNRPDPATDPEVQGLIMAQVSAARRFGSAQLDNVSRHMESLHDHFNGCSFDFGITVPTETNNNPYAQSPGLAARAYENYGAPTQPARPMPQPSDCAENGGWISSFAAWVGGTVQFGTVGANGLQTDSRFTTSGLTAGIDWRLRDSLIVGVAVGYGTDHTDLGLRGTRSDATSFSATAYATYKPFDPVFVDAALGFGTLDYDSHRFVTDDSRIADGGRKGNYWFGSVSAGYDLRLNSLKLTPYVRFDFIRGQLDAYSEHGSSVELLTFSATEFSTVSGGLGLRGSYDIPVSWGVLTPVARVEYRRAFDGAFQQSMYYTDLGPSVSSLLVLGSAAQNLINVSAGFRARGPGGMSVELEYGTSFAAGALQVQMLRGAVKMPF